MVSEGFHPAPEAARPSRLSVESLLWTVGLFCSFVGAMFLVTPHHFQSAPYQALVPHSPWWGGLSLVSGVMLIGTAILRPRRLTRFAVHALVSLSLLTLGTSFGLTASWTGMTCYSIFALGVLAAAFLPRSRTASPGVPSAAGDLFSLLMGLVATVNGPILLALAFQPAGDGRWPLLPLFGTLLLVCGPPLCWCQLRPPRSRTVARRVHLLAGVAFALYGAFFSAPIGAWTGVVFYEECGLALALLPWLRERVASVDTSALRTRLAFALATTASLALILTAAVATFQEERLAERQVLETRRIEARAVARNVADYVELNGARTATVAALAGRVPLVPPVQLRVLEGARRAYPDVTAFLSLDLSGALLAEVGKGSVLSPRHLRDLAADRTRRATRNVEAWIPHGLEPSVLLMSSPVVDAANRVAGFVVAVLDTHSLKQRIDGRRSTVYLADGHGKNIAEWNTAAIEPLPPGWDARYRTGAALQVRERLAAFSRVPGLDWVVAVERTRSDALAGVRGGRDLAFLLLLLMVPFAVGVGIVVARRIARPLHSLAGAVGELTAGNPAAPLEVSDITEVDSLSSAFREMRGRLAQRTRESERLAAELRARAEALADSDRRKDEFLAMLAHELRNPLGAIANASYLLEQIGSGAPGAPQTGRSVAIIRRQIQHLVRMVDDLLDVSRITRGKVELRREPVDLRDVVRHAIDTTRPMLDAKSQHLEVSVPDEPVPLLADVTRLEQVLANLIRNSAKYTDPGGRIEVSARRDGAQAMLRVRDDGMGISADLLPRVFDLFTQGEQALDRAGSGLGIGLTLVRRLVEMHGGKVEAHSDGPGSGSEFVVWLPLAPAAGSPLGEREEIPAGPPPQFHP